MDVCLIHKVNIISLPFPFSLYFPNSLIICQVKTVETLAGKVSPILDLVMIFLIRVLLSFKQVYTVIYRSIFRFCFISIMRINAGRISGIFATATDLIDF